MLTMRAFQENSHEIPLVSSASEFLPAILTPAQLAVPITTT